MFVLLNEGRLKKFDVRVNINDYEIFDEQETVKVGERIHPKWLGAGFQYSAGHSQPAALCFELPEHLRRADQSKVRAKVPLNGCDISNFQLRLVVLWRGFVSWT
jgi:hypothetical protein